MRVACLFRSDLNQLRETIINRKIYNNNISSQSKPKTSNNKVLDHLPIIPIQLSEGPTGKNVGAINTFVGVEQILQVSSQYDNLKV